MSGRPAVTAAWVAFVAAWAHCPTSALDNGLGATPPMGWSSWNVFAGDITEAKIMSIIDAMVSLKSAGYEYVNIDDNWMEPTRDSAGNLVTRADKFPRGIKFLADYAHDRGLKLGIYSAHGNRTCMGNAGSYGHYQQDANLFASWGIDYLKLDTCGGEPSNYTAVTEQHREYAAMRDALNATGRPIYYSICQIMAVPANRTVAWESPSACGRKASYNVLGWAEAGLDPREVSNSFLIEWANNNNYFNKGNCTGWLNNLDSQQDLTLDSYSQPGSWNDNDMLSVGCNNLSAPSTRASSPALDAHARSDSNTTAVDASTEHKSVTASAGDTPCTGHQSETEQRAQFALWCMQASPLILGHDVRTMDATVRDIITNPDMIALNQDPLGKRARIAYQSDPKVRTLTVFVKELSDPMSPRAASLFNRGETPATMTLTREMLGLSRGTCTCLNATDLDRHAVVAHKVTGESVLSTTVQPHQALTVRLACC